MKGFDYSTGKAVDRRLSNWKSAASTADFQREDRQLGETFLYRKTRTGPVMLAEIYEIDLNLKTKETK